MVNILDMHRRHGEFAWRVHDERFRRVRALGTSMPWHLTNWDFTCSSDVVVRQSDTQQPPFRFGQQQTNSTLTNSTLTNSPPSQWLLFWIQWHRQMWSCRLFRTLVWKLRAIRGIGKNAKTRSSHTHRLNHYLSGYTPYRIRFYLAMSLADVHRDHGL